MKNRFAICALIALSFFIFSCSNNDSFTISGTFKNPGTLKMVYLLEADSVKVNIVDSTEIKDGKFEFKRKTPFANLLKLRAGGAIFDIVAKNGETITFSTDMSDEMHAYEVNGSEESKKIQAYNQISTFYGDRNVKLATEYQTKVEAIGQETDSLVLAYRPLFKKNIDETNDAVLKFINDNKYSLAAFYAMTSLDPLTYEQ